MNALMNWDASMRTEKKKCHFASIWSSSEIGRNRPFISEECLNFGRLSPILRISHLQTSLIELGNRHQAARRWANINRDHARSLVTLDRLSLHKIKGIHKYSRVFSLAGLILESSHPGVL